MAEYYIDVSVKKGRIDRNIYGHFSEHLGRCIYGGLYVGEDSNIPNKNGMRTDVVNALKEIKIPVLRWPGGCFADEYHWKDGVGPRSKRKKMINSHWGGVVEDNSFGTHEFLELCSQLECEPYICGNVGSGTVQKLSEWVEYINFEGLSPMTEWRKENGQDQAWNLRFLGVGNENWGCGGNMTPEFYANNYRRYQTYARNYNDKKLFRIACGPNTDDYEWTEVLMKLAARYMDGLSLHYYTVPGKWDHKGSATEFDEAEFYTTLKKALFMEELICKHTAIMDRYDSEKRVNLVVDEWGTWFDVEPGTNPGFLYQQNTIRDALVAGSSLNIFNKHCDRVKMANIAQTVNVLQSVILTDGADMLLTPTYFVYKLYTVHHDAELVHSLIKSTLTGTDGQLIPNLNESASVDKNGVLNITLCNLDLETPQTVNAAIAGGSYSKIAGEILFSEIHSANTFEAPDKVRLSEFSDCKVTSSGFDAVIPPHSIVRLSLS
jgi:alpha-N-arabinofuranosidase